MKKVFFILFSVLASSSYAQFEKKNIVVDSILYVRNISLINDSSFSDLITHISFSCKKVESVPKFVNRFRNIVVLDFSESMLNSFYYSNDKLRVLDLSSTPSFDLVDFYFPSLEVLYLSFRGEQKVSKTILGLKDLKELYLEGNAVKRIPPDLLTSSRITTLNLAFNLIEEIPKLNTCSELKYLDLSYNKLESNKCCFNRLSKLKVLHLDNNRLDSLSLNSKDLEILTLCDNEFTKIPQCLFGLKSLRLLDVRGCSITENDIRKFVGMNPKCFIVYDDGISKFDCYRYFNSSLSGNGESDGVGVAFERLYNIPSKKWLKKYYKKRLFD